MTIPDSDQNFSYIYEKYFNRIYAYILQRVKNKQDCEDLVSQVFTKVYTKISSQREPDKTASWLFRIAHNEMIDFFRKRKRKNHFLTRLFKEQNSIDSYSPEQAFLAGEKNERIMQLMSILPDQKQEILILRFFGQLTNREIGEVIGKKESAIKMIVYRSIQQLRHEIQKEDKNNE